MNNKYAPMVVVGVIALLVGLFGGYYYEKTKLTKMMADQAQSYQTQLDQAKQAGAQSAAMQPTQAVSEPIAMSNSAKVGSYVTDPKGMALYTYAKDTTNVSNCTGACLSKWPPFLVSGSVPTNLPAHLGTFKNAQGQTQYTWNGMPLYYYAGDTKAGEINGNGLLGVWYLAK